MEVYSKLFQEKEKLKKKKTKKQSPKNSEEDEDQLIAKRTANQHEHSQSDNEIEDKQKRKQKKSTILTEDVLVFSNQTNETTTKRPQINKNEDLGLKYNIQFNIKNTDIDDDSVVSPWLSENTKDIKDPLYRLHNEIIEFYKYISPDAQESKKREKAFERVKNLFMENIPGILIKPFGSYVSQLYLPGSDIDCVIVSSEYSDKTLMNKVAKILMKEKSNYDDVNVIRGAKVPIVKFRDKQDNLNFDISFNKLDGVYQLKAVKRALELYPALKYLIMIMKLVLRQRDLNETFKGGIGSFLLFCMVLAFLREHKKDHFSGKKTNSIQDITLGEYLLKFMEFYGITFDCSNEQIIMNNGGAIIPKTGHRDQSFSLMSPQDNSHDIGNAAFKIRDIFAILKNRYNFMTNYNYKPRESILKYLVNPSKRPFNIYL